MHKFTLINICHAHVCQVWRPHLQHLSTQTLKPTHPHVLEAAYWPHPPAPPQPNPETTHWNVHQGRLMGPSATQSLISRAACRPHPPAQASTRQPKPCNPPTRMFSRAASNLALSREHSSRTAVAATSGLGAMRSASSVWRRASDAWPPSWGEGRCYTHIRHSTCHAHMHVCACVSYLCLCTCTQHSFCTIVYAHS